MGILENKIITLQQDLVKMKSSQPMGGDNYCVYTEKTNFTAYGGASWQYYWLYYESTSSFPLCQWLFTIEENGSTVIPKSYNDYGFGNSQGTYDYTYSYGMVAGANGFKSLPQAGLYNPNINLILLTIVIPRNVTSSIEVICKSSQPGIIRLEKTSL